VITLKKDMGLFLWRLAIKLNKRFMNLQEKQQKASEVKNQIREKQAQIDDLIKITDSKLSSIENGVKSLKLNYFLNC